MQFMTQSIIYKNTVLTCTDFLQGVTHFETGDESSINKLSNTHCADTSHSQQHIWTTACRSQVWALNKKCCILAHENFTNFMAVSIIANQLFFGCIIFNQWHQFHAKYTTLGSFWKDTFSHHRKLYHRPWGHTKKSHGLSHTTSVSSCYACLYSTLLCILLQSSRVLSIYTLTVTIFSMAWAGGEGQSGKPSVEPVWPWH